MDVQIVRSRKYRVVTEYSKSQNINLFKKFNPLTQKDNHYNILNRKLSVSSQKTHLILTNAE